MKAASFDYQAPTSVEEAVALLAAGDDVRVLAGGQSLVPLLAMRLARPATLVDLNGVDELAYVRRDNGCVAVGAMTRQRQAEQDPLLGQAVPALAGVLAHVGHVTIRNRGTVGGSVAHADPAAELPAAMVALDARLVAAAPGGRRREIAAGDFFRSYFTTALEPGELLAEIRLPVMGARTGWGFEELARRNGDFAIVAVLAVVTLGGDGRVTSARVAVAGAGSTPILAATAGATLAGEAPSATVIDAAAAATAAAIEPVDDIHGTADYRRRVTAVITRRALRAAIARAQERDR